MFDMILENYRKATESTMKMQQDMLRNWTLQWPQMFGAQTFGFPLTGMPASGSAMPGAAWLEQFSAAQKKWGGHGHRDAEQAPRVARRAVQGRDQTIEEAFKVGEAKDPQQFRRLTEELWKQSFECLKTVAESQVRDVQSAMQKCYETASKTASGMKV